MNIKVGVFQNIGGGDFALVGTLLPHGEIRSDIEIKRPVFGFFVEDTLLSTFIQQAMNIALALQHPDDAQDFSVRVFDDIEGLPYECEYIPMERGFVQSDHKINAPHLWALTTAGLKPFFQAEKTEPDKWEAGYAGPDGSLYIATLHLSRQAFGCYVYSVRCKKMARKVG